MAISFINRQTQSGTQNKQWLRLSTITLAWLAATGFGLCALWNYETTPGEIATLASEWPGESHIQRNAELPTLVLFAHPRCPCTRASIGELALIMARCQGRVDAHVLFFKPTEFSSDWEKTDLWRDAEEIPSVKVTWDEDGSEARRFQAATSGFTVLYDPNGRLVFSGGITGSRGHYGDNAGKTAIESILTSGPTDRKSSLVFGCQLLDKGARSNTRIKKCRE
ncbi:MAG: RedB protein [Planctomycetes bacterium]|nr:RedB protein [Planctomycetota bacterium]